jgi:hypothetical protein
MTLSANATANASGVAIAGFNFGVPATLIDYIAGDGEAPPRTR